MQGTSGTLSLCSLITPLGVTPVPCTVSPMVEMRVLTWIHNWETSPWLPGGSLFFLPWHPCTLSLAGAATSIIFVATKVLS